MPEPRNERAEDTFAHGYPFRLDPFQRRGIAALAAGRSVLVSAPTGAGKTVVGEFGVHLALETGGKAFYTTPIKALSNQKFGDLIARYGTERVGLLTGDNSINGEAPIVVMTTEVLRNMLYERSPTLQRLRVVVFDEVHYLKDPYRGATWEEALIHLTEGVQVAALSATVSNAEEFGEWLRSIRGPTDVVVETRRPVPIEHAYLVGPTMHPMFVREGERLKPNPALLRLKEMPGANRYRQRTRPSRGGRSPRVQGHRSIYRPDRVEVVERLEAEGLLPAIAFIFSRAGCDDAVARCRRANLTLTDADERERIREYVELRATVLPADDLAVLGYEEWLDGLLRGIAAHHAGHIPLFKETVEELFERALVKVVFATETLALGINMPAKTVVLERLIKFTGERHEMLTPTDFTQLTGRAGRRGMDEVGYGIVVYQPDVPADRIVALAEGRSFPLVSSFRPSYNMAVNLLRVHDVTEAKRLLNLSFGQFLVDRSVVTQEKKIARNREFVTGYRDHARCDRGDIEEYWAVARVVRATQRRDAEHARRDRTEHIRSAFEAMRPGDVIRIKRGQRAGLVAVVEVRHGKRGEPQPVVMTERRGLSRLGVRDFKEPPAVVGQITLPRGDPRAPRFRHEVAQDLEAFAPSEPRALAPLAEPSVNRSRRRELETHPVFGCPDRVEHEQWLERIDALTAETQNLERRVRRRTESLARTFERVLAVLETFGYVTGEGALTPRGERLTTIYNESDLLVAEAIERGVLDVLDPPELAAVCSTFVYETRIGVPEAAFRTEPARRAFRQVEQIYKRVAAAEDQHHVELVREPDPGFARQIHRWAAGEDLEDVLNDGELPPGDFVRSSKQVWDLLQQLVDVTDAPLSDRCREAARAVYRGVVAYSGAL